MISINPSKGSMAPALASLFAIFALTTGCDQPKNSIVTDSAHTGASEFTIASNKTFGL